MLAFQNSWILPSPHEFWQDIVNLSRFQSILVAFSPPNNHLNSTHSISTSISSLGVSLAEVIQATTLLYLLPLVVRQPGKPYQCTKAISQPESSPLLYIFETRPLCPCGGIFPSLPQETSVRMRAVWRPALELAKKPSRRSSTGVGVNSPVTERCTSTILVSISSCSRLRRSRLLNRRIWGNEWLDGDSRKARIELCEE